MVETKALQMVAKMEYCWVDSLDVSKAEMMVYSWVESKGE